MCAGGSKPAQADSASTHLDKQVSTTTSRAFQVKFICILICVRVIVNQEDTHSVHQRLEEREREREKEREKRLRLF